MSIRNKLHLISFIGIISSVTGLSQSRGSFVLQELQSIPLQLSTETTTNISFPNPIVSFDRGNEGIIAKKALGSENILRVKGSVVAFKPTSLAVITKGGKVYSFLAFYNSCPAAINYIISETKKEGIMDNTEGLHLFPTNEGEVNQAVAERLFNNDVRKISRFKSLGIEATLVAAAIDQGRMYFGITFVNTTNADMEVTPIQVLVKTRPKFNKTTTQEFQIPSEIINGDSSLIASNSTQNLIVAIDKTIIRKDQYLEFEIVEDNGARRLFLRVWGKRLYRLKPLL
jgi:Domain of unknown function (DUF4138)